MKSCRFCWQRWYWSRWWVRNQIPRPQCFRSKTNTFWRHHCRRYECRRWQLYGLKPLLVKKKEGIVIKTDLGELAFLGIPWLCTVPRKRPSHGSGGWARAAEKPAQEGKLGPGAAGRRTEWAQGRNGMGPARAGTGEFRVDSWAECRLKRSKYHYQTTTRVVHCSRLGSVGLSNLLRSQCLLGLKLNCRILTMLIRYGYFPFFPCARINFQKASLSYFTKYSPFVNGLYILVSEVDCCLWKVFDLWDHLLFSGSP